jgi:hypothetical protein
MKKTFVALYEVEGEERTYYKSIVLPRAPLSIWKALAHGAFALFGLDINKLRSERLRKGGR